MAGLAQAPLPVPTYPEYKDFLLSEWKPDAPVAIAFKDPFCPYCIKALEHRADLNAINVFLFWYPIFGERSDLRVAEFFKCRSPVSDSVIAAVINGQSPACTNEANAKLTALNKAMYEAYSPSGVPAYYFGGSKVSFGELKSIKPRTSARGQSVPHVVLDWNRYPLNRIPPKSTGGSPVGIYVPANFSAKKMQELIAVIRKQTGYTWHLFSPRFTPAMQELCSTQVNKCDSAYSQQFERNSSELSLLFGLDSISHPVVILDGNLMSANAARKQFNFLRAFIPSM